MTRTEEKPGVGTYMCFRRGTTVTLDDSTDHCFRVLGETGLF